MEDLRRIFHVLDRSGIPYMVTGSFASSYHGIPRASQDVDVVIDPTADQIRVLAALLPPDEYYMDERTALDALRRRGMFNIVDHRTGWKADLIIRKERPFSLEEFRRREVVDVGSAKLPMATAEDVILSKLEWANASGSNRQIEDAAAILRIRGPELDQGYLRRWVADLDLHDSWDAALHASGIE